MRVHEIAARSAEVRHLSLHPDRSGPAKSQRESQPPRSASPRRRSASPSRMAEPSLNLERRDAVDVSVIAAAAVSQPRPSGSPITPATAAGTEWDKPHTRRPATNLDMAELLDPSIPGPGHEEMRPRKGSTVANVDASTRRMFEDPGESLSYPSRSWPG